MTNIRRKTGESIVILAEEKVVLTVTSNVRGEVTIEFEEPNRIRVVRREVYEAELEDPGVASLPGRDEIDDEKERIQREDYRHYRDTKPPQVEIPMYHRPLEPPKKSKYLEDEQC